MSGEDRTMTGTTGTCPSCGAPIEFSLGASIAKVCEYCRATVCRTDHGLEDIGKVAVIANAPSLVAVGDFGELDGNHIQILGRVQLDHGSGPWDEYYVSINHGSSWSWLAYAEGNWLLTSKMETVTPPTLDTLALEQDVKLGGTTYRVTEIKTARVVSAQGELPTPSKPNETRSYVDLLGPDGQCATIDYGAEGEEPQVFTGWVIAESKLDVTQAGLREGHRVSVSYLKCPDCGADIPRRSGERAQRVGCPYCGSLSDVALNQVIDKQEAAYETPFIPIGSRGTLLGNEYTCIAVVQKQADFDGEIFTWKEFLLFAQGVGFRWLVKDETTWLWIAPVNPSKIGIDLGPHKVTYDGTFYRLRNQQTSHVTHVVGEVYWQVRVGDATKSQDYQNGGTILSREQSPGEVRWSMSTPISWQDISKAFGLPTEGAAGEFDAPGYNASSSVNMGVVIMVAFIMMVLCCIVIGSSGGGGSARGGPPIVIFGGSSGFSGGK